MRWWLLMSPLEVVELLISRLSSHANVALPNPSGPVAHDGCRRLTPLPRNSSQRRNSSSHSAAAVFQAACGSRALPV